MAALKIPGSFRLLGRGYVVKVVPAAEWKEEGCVAFLYENAAEVHLMEHSVDMMGHAFLHELVHAILNAMGEERLSKDERFVDLLSGLLHQALTSEK